MPCIECGHGPGDGCQPGTKADQAINAKAAHQTGIELVRHHDADNTEGEEQVVLLGRHLMMGDIGHWSTRHVGKHGAIETAADPCIG